MSHACTPILVGVVSPVSELWLLFACLQKRPKFPFGPWTIVHGHQKFNRLESAQKIMQVGIDVTCMHTNFGGHGLSGFGVMASFCLPSKTTKISLQTMDYSPRSSKYLIDWNQLKKFMQVGIDVTCIHINFGWRGLFGFGVMASFCLPSKTAKISLRTMDYSPWSSKNLIDWNRLKKFMQIGIDVTCMHTNFGWCGLSGFGVMASFCLPSKMASDHAWSSKNLIDWNQLKKFMQIGIDVTCMHTNFGWCGLSGFGVMASFCLPSKTAKISLRTMDYSPWSSKNLIDWNRLKKFM